MIPERYAPEIPFPAYAFVPGKHPHPVTDPRGHSYRKSDSIPEPLQPDSAFRSIEFRYAVDLFNAGYYWEAHEAWEQLWVAARRTGVMADFLKALIKLAAAGVKAREGQVGGVRRHATRADELLESVRKLQPAEKPNFAAVNLDRLLRSTNSLIQHPVIDNTPTAEGRPVLGMEITLNRETTY